MKIKNKIMTFLFFYSSLLIFISIFMLHNLTGELIIQSVIKAYQELELRAGDIIARKMMSEDDAEIAQFIYTTARERKEHFIKVYDNFQHGYDKIIYTQKILYIILGKEYDIFTVMFLEIIYTHKVLDHIEKRQLHHLVYYSLLFFVSV